MLKLWTICWVASLTSYTMIIGADITGSSPPDPECFLLLFYFLCLVSFVSQQWRSWEYWKLCWCRRWKLAKIETNKSNTNALIQENHHSLIHWGRWQDNSCLRMSLTCMQQSQWRCSIWVSIYHEVLFRLIMIYLLTSCQHPATKDLFLRNTKQLVNTSFKQSRVLEKERLKVEVTISYFIISGNYQISFN